MNTLVNFLKGMAMGVANIIPGVSGGTLAVVLNIYDDLVGAISGFFKDWRRALRYLVPIGGGAGIGILLFSKIVKFFIENYNTITNFFFIGLIVGSCPILLKKAAERRYKRRKRRGRIKLIPFVITLTLVIIIEVMVPQKGTSVIIRSLDLVSFLTLFVAGIIGAIAMIIPGISGSFVFLLLGVYSTIITAVAEFNVIVLIPVAIGGAIGILLASELMNQLLKRYPRGTYSAILGFVLGSIFALYPGFSFTIDGLISIIVFLIGSYIAYLLGGDQKTV